MGRYASGRRRLCKSKSVCLSGRYRQLIRLDSMNRFVPFEIINQRIARLHFMKLAFCRRSLEQGAQLHEPMTGAARIEGVKGNDVFLVALQRAAVFERQGRDFTRLSTAFCRDIESDESARLARAVCFL